MRHFHHLPFIVRSHDKNEAGVNKDGVIQRHTSVSYDGAVTIPIIVCG